MSKNYQSFPRTDFGQPPPGYVPGAGRGAHGFTTQNDIVSTISYISFQILHHILIFAINILAQTEHTNKTNHIHILAQTVTIILQFIAHLSVDVLLF